MLDSYNLSTKLNVWFVALDSHNLKCAIGAAVVPAPSLLPGGGQEEEVSWKCEFTGAIKEDSMLFTLQCGIVGVLDVCYRIGA